MKSIKQVWEYVAEIVWDIMSNRLSLNVMTSRLSMSNIFKKNT